LRVQSYRWLVTIMAAAMILIALTPAHAAQSAVQTNCTFSGTLDELVYYFAPLTDPSQQKGVAPGGVPYPVLKQSGEHFLIQLDQSGYGGWVDRRSGILGGDCSQVPVDDTPLSGYDTLCFFTSAGTPPLYAESNLITPQGNAQANTPYVVTLKSATSYLLRLDHAFGVWVAAGTGQLSGFGCNTLPVEYVAAQATALANARMWSAPDVKTGVRTVDLAAGTLVTVIGGPVRGPIRFDTDDQGNWYQVRRNMDGQTGWVWEQRLAFTDPPDPGVTATVLANARAWSEPNVRMGGVLANLAEGSQVVILEGPVNGPIRYDTNDRGDWYLVQQTATHITGWVWVERLAFN
jgi:hypothetical protein